MPKYRDLNRLDILPASWTDAIQEGLSSLAQNVRFTVTATQVTIPASAGTGQVTVSVAGLWRYITANLTAVHPGGGAGVYDILAVASANIFADTPQPDTDTTDYTFGIQLVATGGAASGTHGGRAITASRKLGEYTWDGAKITGIRKLVDGDDTQPITATSTADAVTPIKGKGTATQTAPLLTLGTNAAADDKASVSAAGALTLASTANATGYLVSGTALASTHLSDTATLARLAGPSFTGVPSAPTAAPGTNTTQLSTTAFVAAAVSAATSASGGVAYLSTTQNFTGAKTFSNSGGLTIDVGSGTENAVLTLTARTAGTANTATFQAEPGGSVYLRLLASQQFGVSIAGTPKGSWDATGINIPTGSNYRINNAQISASNLSNGTTGTGALVLASGAALADPTTNQLTIALGTEATLNLNHTGAGVDLKRSRLRSVGGVTSIESVNDAYSAATAMLALQHGTGLATFTGRLDLGAVSPGMRFGVGYTKSAQHEYMQFHNATDGQDWSIYRTAFDRDLRFYGAGDNVIFHRAGGATVGNARSGPWVGNGAIAAWGHSSAVTTSGAYAMLQDSSGGTYVNAANTQSIWMRINNNTIARFASSALFLESGAASSKLYWRRSGAPANQRDWQMYTDDTQLILGAVNDADSAQGIPLQIIRSGTTITAFNMTASSFSMSGGPVTLGNGKLTLTIGGWGGAHDLYAIYNKNEPTDTGAGAGYGGKLYIRNHAGIKYDAYADGGGHRFYIGYNPSGEVQNLAFAVGNANQKVFSYLTHDFGGSAGTTPSINAPSDIVLTNTAAAIFLGGHTYAGHYIGQSGTTTAHLASNNNNKMSWNSTGVGFYGTAPIAKQTVNYQFLSDYGRIAALAYAMEALGLITNINL